MVKTSQITFVPGRQDWMRRRIHWAMAASSLWQVTLLETYNQSVLFQSIVVTYKKINYDISSCFQNNVFTHDIALILLSI